MKKFILTTTVLIVATSLPARSECPQLTQNDARSAIKGTHPLELNGKKYITDISGAPSKMTINPEHARDQCMAVGDIIDPKILKATPQSNGCVYEFYINPQRIKCSLRLETTEPKSTPINILAPTSSAHVSFPPPLEPENTLEDQQFLKKDQENLPAESVNQLRDIKEDRQDIPAAISEQLRDPVDKADDWYSAP